MTLTDARLRNNDGLENPPCPDVSASAPIRRPIVPKEI